MTEADTKATGGTTVASWYDETVMPGVDPMLPGIYEWRIEGVGCYIGQYGKARRPRREYALNVGRILSERPYRKNKQDGFRQIHHELAKAVKAGHAVSLTLLENCTMKPGRNQRERELIAERRAQAEAGGLRVLNSN